MFSVSLSTLSTEGERREGGLAVPTGTLAFSGDSGTRAKPEKNKRLCKPYFVRFLSHAPRLTSFRSNDEIASCKVFES